MGLVQIAHAYGIVLLGSVSSTTLYMVVVLLFKNSSTCTAFFGILSAASEFVIGAYIPLSQFSDGVQSVCNLFPASHITSMIVFVLYLLFLKDTFVDALTATMKGLENIVSSGDIDMFVNERILKEQKVQNKDDHGSHERKDYRENVLEIYENVSFC